MLARVLKPLIASVTLPLVLPAVFGANVIFNELDCPAAKFIGALRPLTVKSVPETVACETTMPTLEVFAMLTSWVRLVPRVTFPKSTFEGLSVNGAALALGEVEPLPLTMAQPFKPTTHATTRKKRTNVYRNEALFREAGPKAART